MSDVLLISCWIWNSSFRLSRLVFLLRTARIHLQCFRNPGGPPHVPHFYVCYELNSTPHIVPVAFHQYTHLPSLRSMFFNYSILITGFPTFKTGLLEILCLYNICHHTVLTVVQSTEHQENREFCSPWTLESAQLSHIFTFSLLYFSFFYWESFSFCVAGWIQTYYVA